METLFLIITLTIFLYLSFRKKREYQTDTYHKFDVDYFIKKFEAIPEHEIGTGALIKHCSLWHCGMMRTNQPTAEANALMKLFGGNICNNTVNHGSYELVYSINDGNYHCDGVGNTPKERILNKLYSLKSK